MINTAIPFCIRNAEVLHNKITCQVQTLEKIGNNLKTVDEMVGSCTLYLPVLDFLFVFWLTIWLEYIIMIIIYFVIVIGPSGVQFRE